MKTKSGILELGKNEVKELELLIAHVLRDIEYGEGGTFGDPNDEENQKKLDKEVKKVENAIGNLRWIIHWFAK